MTYLNRLGITIYTWLGVTLLITTMMMFLGGGISKWSLLASLLVTILLCLILGRKEKYNIENNLITVILLGLCLGIALFVATKTIDFSWDGQSYHQEALIQLKNGWNPVKNNNLYEFLGLAEESSFRAPFWISHYPQGLWYLQATFYDLTGSIESGKVVNGLLIIGLLSITYPFLATKMKNKIQALIVTLLVAFNPVVISQVFTFYNDGTVYLLLAALIVLSLAWFDTQERDKTYLLGIFSVIITLISIKFTALGYVLVIIIIPFSLIVKQVIESESITNLWSKKNIWAYTTVLLALLIGILFVGKSSYLNNTLNYGHPFYPLAGKDKVDIMTYNYVEGAEKFGRIEGLYISQMSETNNNKTKAPRTKFPLIIRKLELKELVNPDTRIGGFGPWFGAALLLMVIGLSMMALKKRDKTNSTVIIVTLVIMLSVLINPETWWARYVPQFWLIPLIAFIVLNQVDAKIIKKVSSLLLIVIGVNVLLSVANQVNWQYNTQKHFNEQLTAIRDVENITIEQTNFLSNRIRLEDKNIRYQTGVQDDFKYEIRIVQSTSKILTNDSKLFNQLLKINTKYK